MQSFSCENRIDKPSVHGAFCFMKKEKWMPINKYVGLYEVSNFGRIKSLRILCKCRLCGSELKERNILTLSKNHDGYLIIGLTKNKKHKIFKLHRLVAESFIKNPEKKQCVDHIDGDKKNNNVSNLRWVTIRENAIYRSKANRKYPLATGVHLSKYGRYIAQISIGKKRIHLGSFKTEEDGHRAYIEKLKEITSI